MLFREEILKLRELIDRKREVSATTLSYKMMVRHGMCFLLFLGEEKEEAIKKHDAKEVFYEE